MKMRKRGYPFVFQLFFFFSIIFFTADAPLFAQEQLTANGSSTIRPVVRIAARIYGKKHNVRMKVMGGGSSKGVQSAGQGKVDFGMASRYLMPKEQRAYPGIMHHTIGFDGIAMIINKDNPIDTLTTSQVRDIYTGRINNWKAVGGKDIPITLISQQEGRSTLDLFIKYFNMEVEDRKNGIHYRNKGASRFSGKAAIPVGANSQTLVNVSQNPGAIGYVSIGSAVRAERKLGTVKRLVLEGVAATRENVRNRSYPIIRPLNIVTNGRPRGHVKGMIEYLLSPNGQNIVKNLDYIPIK